MVLATLVLLLGGAAVLWVWLQSPQTPERVAVTPAAAPAAVPTPADASSSPALPITPAPMAIAVDNSPFGVTPAESNMPLPTASAATQAPKHPPVVAPVRKEVEKDAGSLMVLDAAAKPEQSASRPLVAASTARPPQAQAHTRAASTPNSRATVPSPQAGVPAAKPPGDIQVTIVDIAGDGSFALITNPTTRLPERIVVGQKIFTGEVVVKIDAAAGKVQFDKRTVGLQ
jgi:hypothetical protein